MIFTYVAEAKEQLKAEKTIQDDFGGKTSDEVLFDISQRKLNIMNTILKLIKEAIDCSLNSWNNRRGRTIYLLERTKYSNEDYSFCKWDEHQDLVGQEGSR